MKIRWKEGSRFKCTPGSAYNFFERVRQENGGDIDWYDAERQARLKGAAIHDDLEWSDKRCGILYRIDQMKRMVRKLEYIPEKTQIPVRVYESIQVEVAEQGTEPETRSVYRKTEDILADPAGRAELLGQAVRDALAFRKRYAALSELAQVIEAIDKTVEAVGQ